jgi:hypothetical protein
MRVIHPIGYAPSRSFARAATLVGYAIVLARSTKSLIEAADAVADGVLDTVTSP